MRHHPRQKQACSCQWKWRTESARTNQLTRALDQRTSLNGATHTHTICWQNTCVKWCWCYQTCIIFWSYYSTKIWSTWKSKSRLFKKIKYAFEKTGVLPAIFCSDYYYYYGCWLLPSKDALVVLAPSTQNRKNYIPDFFFLKTKLKTSCIGWPCQRQQAVTQRGQEITD